MIRIRQAKVHKVLSCAPGLTEIQVEQAGVLQKAMNYDQMTGPVKAGDVVILNTTAVQMGLGTGGYHFVMANLANLQVDAQEAGHVMKMRYAPHQVKVLTVEEQGSPYRQEMEDFESLKGMPVVIGTLHSQLPLAAVGVKLAGLDKLKVAYIMTDGAALPVAFSKLVRELKTKGLIDSTITIGHAFGGDYEAVNIYTGLIAAKEVAKADVAIVTMGPGILGTGTEYGFSGVEQGTVINAVNTLGGKPIVIPRISFADPRERHVGVSHHTLTVLDKIALTSGIVCVPDMDPVKNNYVQKQFHRLGINTRHRIEVLDGWPAVRAAQEKYSLRVTTMGRRIEEDQEFFLAAGAAGIFAQRELVY